MDGSTTRHVPGSAGRQRSAGNFSTERKALRAAVKAEAAIEAVYWFDVSAGKVTFRAFAREVWWPSLHLEPTTKAAYKSNRETHFQPFFGDTRMANILPSHVQGWVDKALEAGLTPRSVVKHHEVLHGIFHQAVRDRVIPFNPAAETRCPRSCASSAGSSHPGSSRACTSRFPPLVAARAHQHRDRGPLPCPANSSRSSSDESGNTTSARTTCCSPHPRAQPDPGFTEHLPHQGVAARG